MSSFEIVTTVCVALGLWFGVFALSCMFDGKKRYEFSWSGFIKWTICDVWVAILKVIAEDKNREEKA